MAAMTWVPLGNSLTVCVSAEKKKFMCYGYVQTPTQKLPLIVAVCLK